MSRKIEVLLVGDETQLTAALGKASAQVNTFAGRLDRTGKSLTQTGRSMTRNLSVPVALAGAAAVKTAVDFNTSMTHIQALVGASSKQMNQYTRAILRLSPAVGKGPKELADALYFITSSGFKGAAALDVLTVSAKAAASGLGDTQTIADLVTSAVTVYGAKNLSAAHAVDVLTQAVKDGKGEPSDYATSLGRIIPIAQNLGVSFDQSAAAIASLTLAGFSADKATTGLASIFTNLSKTSKSADAELKRVGLSAAGIRQEIKDKGLLPALMDLNKAEDGNAINLRKIFTSGKAIVPFLALTGQAAQKNVGVFHDLANSTGASAAAFQKASGSDMFKFNQDLAQLQVTGVKVGNSLIPVLIQVAGEVGGVAKAFGELSPETQHVIITAALIVAALGPVTTVAGNVSRAVGLMAKAYSALVPASEAAAGAVEASNVAMAAGAAPAAVGASELAGFATGAGAAEAGAVGATAGIAGLTLGTALLTGGTALAVVGIAALAIKFSEGGDAASRAAAQMENLKLAIDNVSTASRGAQDASQALKQGHLDVSTTARAVTDAEHAYAKAVKASGKNSETARAAFDALTQARINHENALTNLTDKEKTYTAATNAARKVEQTALHAVASTTRAYKSKIAAMDSGAKAEQDRILATQQYSTNLHAQADALRSSAAKVDAYNPKLAALERREAAAADAAANLAAQLNRLPTKKDIYITTHYADLHTGITQSGGHKNVNPHALGGFARIGEVSLVGERGPELRVEESNARYIPTNQTQRALGEQVVHIHLHGGTYIGVPSSKVGKALADVTAPHLARATSRRG